MLNIEFLDLFLIRLERIQGEALPPKAFPALSPRLFLFSKETLLLTDHHRIEGLNQGLWVRIDRRLPWYDSKKHKNNTTTLILSIYMHKLCQVFHYISLDGHLVVFGQKIELQNFWPRMEFILGCSNRRPLSCDRIPNDYSCSNLDRLMLKVSIVEKSKF